METDPEQIFAKIIESYASITKTQEIAKRDAQQEEHRLHVEMHEMDAWDEYAVEAFKNKEVWVGMGHPSDVAIVAKRCAEFASALLRERRAAFLMGDDDKS